MEPLACPRCAQLDQVASVQSVYGAQAGMTHSTGMAVGAVIGVGPMAMTTTSTSAQASHLAMRIAPPPIPRRGSVWNCGILVILGACTFMALLGLGGVLVSSGPPDSSISSAEQSHDRTVGYAFVIVFTGIILATFVVMLARSRTLKRRYDDYKAVWPAMTHLWQNAMLCLRCHGAYFPPGAVHHDLGPRHLIPLDTFQHVIADLGTRLALAPSSIPIPPALPPASPSS
jgi:hypothetical protein